MKIRKRFPKYQIKDLKLMKKLILFGLCMFMLVGIVSAEWIYQIDSNETICGGSWDGSQTCALTTDNDWDTYGTGTGLNIGYLYVNYTKPGNALNSTLWEYKDDGARGNLSIPIHCWDYSETKIVFSVESWNDVPFIYGEWNCMNTSNDWHRLRFANSNNDIYEEAVWWNISDAPPPPTPPQLNITSISKTSILTINKGGMLTISK